MSDRLELRQQVERLIIENRNSLNDPTTNEPYDVKGIADDVIQLIDSKIIGELELIMLRRESGGRTGIRNRVHDRITELKALNHRKDDR